MTALRRLAPISRSLAAGQQRFLNQSSADASLRQFKQPLLLHTAGTPNGRKVSALLEELRATTGLQYDVHKIDFSVNMQKAPWYVKLNPNGRIPVLVDRNRGDFTVFETAAILLYLEQHYDPERVFSFDPVQEPNEYSEMLQWLFWAHGGLGPMQGQAGHFRNAAPLEIPYAQKRYTDETERLYGVLELRLTDRDYLAGPGKGKYSIADINAHPWVMGHKWAGIESLDKWPGMKRWIERIAERPTIQAGICWTLQLRTYATRGRRPKPGTSEKPAFHHPDPLVNNPKAVVTPLPDEDLTFIHRVPPTAPSPHSLATAPTSPLLRPPAPVTGPLPPLMRKPAPEPERASDLVVAKIRHLRRSDPNTYTRLKLAEMFGVTVNFVGAIAALKSSARQARLKISEEKQAKMRENWSEKKLTERAIRAKRPCTQKPPRTTPPHFLNSDHRQRCLVQLRSKQNGLEKYIYLSGLKERDPNLFYEVLLGNMLEIIPILYTPTVGDACSEYSHIWRHPEGLYVSIENCGHIRDVLRTWPGGATSRIAVVTDGSRILGLGDLGANGLPISIGKLDLYIAGAGIKPATTVPICLDLGTNTQRFLDDPLYLGVRRNRPGVEEMDGFMTEFMEAMKEVFPSLLVQFEDFSTDNAFRYLEMFRSQYRCFNDDIQGTGAVVLSGFINAARISSAASGKPLTDHRILFFGAGSAGIGVAKQLVSFFKMLGMSEEESRSRIYTVDSKGLITADRKGLQEHKKYFARTDYQGAPLTNLHDIINYVKPTALLGLSTVRNAFTEDVVRLMASINPRPIVFPLSNPVSLCEVDYVDAIHWTDSSVIFASGSPYKPIEYAGKVYEPGQGNNMYIFPGIGMGAILSKARHVTSSMVEQAAIALSESLSNEEQSSDLVYPRLARIREISARIALAVIRAAQEDGVDENGLFRNLPDAALLDYIKAKQWHPTLIQNGIGNGHGNGNGNHRL
ncbi:hypothetical protein DXG01_011938 [Tephrocybe rancida]|nr:hypothetical protein DXG01_011938 [Tephrocybe rancida]